MLEKTGSNIGSICRLRVIDQNKVATFPDQVKGRLLSEISLAEGAAWEDVRFTRDTAHFVEKEDGGAYSMVIKFTAPKNSIPSLASIEELEQGRYIVDFTDMNGTRSIAGVPGEACKILCEMRDAGQNRRDSNLYNIVIKLSRRERVPIYPY